MPNFRTAQSSVIDIEIIPMVNCKFSKRKPIYSHTTQNQNAFNEKDVSITTDLLESALSILKREPKKISQSNLFNDDNKNQSSKDRPKKKDTNYKKNN